MADLGTRLLSAGLVTRAQLARALAAAPPHGGALVQELVRQGVDEDALAGFFIAEGYGPLMETGELGQADEGAVQRLSGPVAEALLAMPVRSSPGGLVVAMADPSDAHAVSEVRYAVSSRVLPTVARLSDLRAAIHTRWPQLADEPPPGGPEKDADPSRYISLDELGLDDEELGGAPPEDAAGTEPSAETPIALVRRRVSDDRPGLYAGSTRGGERRDAKLHHVAGRNDPVPSDDAVPLVRPKPTPASGGPRMVAKPPSRRPGRGWGRTTAAFERSQTADYEIPASEPDGVPATGGDLPPSSDRWGDLSTPSSSPPPPRPSSRPPSEKLTWRARASIRVPPVVSRPPGEIGGVLAGIRGAQTRDEIVRLACEGAMTVGRCAVFLALRRGNLQGRAVVGAGVSEDAIRNLVIPVSSPSIFQRVVSDGQPFLGPHGHSAADVLFRAAVGSRGGDVLAVPIVLSGKTAAVLCVDDLRHGDEGRQRVEVLAHAVGEAFKRIIVSHRTGS